MTSTTDRSSNKWSVTYPGFHIEGYYSDHRKLYTIHVKPPPGDIPSFKLTMQAPLPGKTTVLLPGSTTVLQLTRDDEIRVATMSGLAERESDHLEAWFRRMATDDELVSIVKEVLVDDVYTVEARAGFCEELDEGFVLVCCYKFCMGSESSPRSAVSEIGYERFLDGL